MATYTPVHPDEELVDGAAVQDHATLPLDLDAEPELRSLAHLDHRARARTIPAHLATPGHYLSLRDGADQEHLLPIRERIMHVGRSITADVRFDEVQVSRRHAIIARYGHHVRLLDDRSANGTFVNGCRIVAADLFDGDVIRLGRVALRYRRVR